MALTCTWGGYADTDIAFTEFFNGDHTIAVRFMLQYPNAYTGPMLSVNGTGTYLIGQGDFFAAPGSKIKLVMQLGTGQVSNPVSVAAGTWHHLAVVRSGSSFQLYFDGKAVGSSLSLPASGLPTGKLRLGKNTFDAALDGGAAQFYGLLDDLAIFKKALSAARSTSLRVRPTSPATKQTSMRATSSVTPRRAGCRPSSIGPSNSYPVRPFSKCRPTGTTKPMRSNFRSVWPATCICLFRRVRTGT